MKRFKKLISLFVFIGIIFLITPNLLIYLNSSGKNYDQLSEVPFRSTALVLGTSKYMRNGESNKYYEYRLDAAKELYDSKKISSILVSGDNQLLEYNEPVKMQIDLIERGIPKEDIYLDYAGFRTLDSVIRAKEVFGQEEIVIVSQKYHNNRALLIASINDIDAVAYNASSPNEGFDALSIRELLARVKLMIDILTQKQPKFLGEKIEIE